MSPDKNKLGPNRCKKRGNKANTLFYISITDPNDRSNR
jgi:hypothetical protein